MHKLTEINSLNRDALCSVCGPTSIQYKGKTKNGFDKWRCSRAAFLIKTRRNRPYSFFFSKTCSICGFVPEDLCQLDVDHIDGNRKNNDESNLQTLCANCHRLKTKQNKDWKIL
jgi:5-methylcytosine-specific restriction endonuclease McrA